jgi:hypothetical protein
LRERESQEFRKAPQSNETPGCGPLKSQVRGSNHHALDLIEREFTAPPVIELRGARAGMVRHAGRLLERAAVFQVGGDPGRAEAVIADLCANAGRGGAPSDHEVGVGLGQGGAGDHNPA